MKRQQIPAEALITLARRLDALPPRSSARRQLIVETGALYGVSNSTLYRALRDRQRPSAAHRSDYGAPRKLAAAEMQRYCEIIAAFKIRTLNKKGRHLSTTKAIALLVQHGVNTPAGFVRVSAGVLTRATVNRYLKLWGYDHGTLRRESPAVRFQAEFSNQRWQFDLSPSDLKHVEKPAWVDPARGHPLLMLYSVVDDRSGVCYQEYHPVYGEDTEAALRFLFNRPLAKVT